MRAVINTNPEIGSLYRAQYASLLSQTPIEAAESDTCINLTEIHACSAALAKFVGRLYVEIMPAGPDTNPLPINR